MPAVDPTLARDLLELRLPGAAIPPAEQILQLVPVAIYVCDAGGRLTFCNRAASELLGREPTLGADNERWCAFYQLLRADGVALPAGETPMAIALREGRAFRELAAHVARANGTTFVASISIDPIRDGAGHVVGSINVFQDITPHRVIESRPTDEAWRDTNERLRLAMRTGKIGLWDWDVANDCMTWTDSLYAIHGIRREQFAGTAASFAALVHPDDRAPVQRAIQSALDHDAPYELEFRAVRPGGGVAWLFTNATVVRENQRAVRMVGATFDITARKTAELALRESETRFRTLASHAPVGIFLTDANGDCVFVNDVWRTLSGLSPDQARGKSWTNAIHPDDRERVSAEWSAAAKERRPFASEHRFRRPDGAVCWVESSAVVSCNANGQPTGYIGILVDITERKIAEDALRGSEKRFRTLASHAPVGIFLTSITGQTIFVNQAWTRMAGVTAEQARGNDWSNAVHPDDRKRVLRGWDEARRRDASSSAEYRFLHRDGSITWVQGNAVQLHDEQGRPTGYIGTIVDVTERKASEEKLRAQEAQLRLISTNAPIMLTHCSRTNRFLFVNRAYAERFGLEPEEIIGRSIAEIAGEEAVRVIQPYVERVLNGETLSYEAEVPYARLGRRFMRVAYAPDIAADGTVQGWLAAVSDITEEKHAEDALRRLAAIVESSDDAILSEDMDGVITSWNEGAERIYGYTAEETIGQPIFMLIPPERHEEQAAILARTRRGERIDHFDTIRQRKDGALIDISLTISPLKNAAGEVVGFSIIGRDITQQKRDAAALQLAQQRLQAHADELEQKVQERTASLSEAIVQMEEFSYSVSHDLRAPLRAMHAYAQALTEDYGDRLDSTAKHYLSRIQRSSERMEKLTHDVLSYSRVARDEVKLASLDLEPLIDDVISHYAELQPERADVEVCRPLLRVRAHESSLGQCLANLLTNAAKFVETGVRPQIAVRTEPRPEGRVRIWLEDNGIGIAPENQARLFHLFERVPSRHSYEGTGIGLAIVRKAVEKMGGTCGVVSDGRNGSRFWIELARG